ncbi:MAG: FHA domain-containing protein [Nocardioides sp.]|nr:FHA domain-containing protein [Nocardioides sp.]
MSAERRFATGDWYAVVGDHVSVMLPGTERARVAALWELADSGASSDAMLDALLAGGLSQLPSFAFVGTGDDHTRVIVRGAPTATVTTDAGEQVITAAPGSTWNEQLLSGVTAARIILEGDAVADHVLTPGLARISAMELGGSVGSVPAPDAAPGLALVEEPVEEPAPAADPEPEPAPEPDPVLEAEPEDDPTPTGETPPVDPTSDEWADRDGLTTVGTPAQDFERPPIPGQEIAPSVVSRPVATLVFSTGDVVEVDRTVLVGRAPEARQFASHDQPQVVTVPSPHQEISSTHLEIRPGAGADHGSAIATDLGSTNGTILVQPGLAPEELKPGIAVSLIPGAVLDLGDGVTIQVTNP